MSNRRSLLAPTACNLASMKELEERRLNPQINESEDPWWEVRRGKALPKAPTNIGQNTQPVVDTHRRSRSVGRSEAEERMRESIISLSQDDIHVEKVVKKTAPIAPNSRLLYITKACRASTEELRQINERRTKTPIDTRLKGPTTNTSTTSVHALTSPNSQPPSSLPGSKSKFKEVQSRLFRPTKASESGSWRHIEATSGPTSPKRVSDANLNDTDGHHPTTTPAHNSKKMDDIVSRLTRPTTATKAAEWRKLEPVATSDVTDDQKPKSPRRSLSEVNERLVRPTAATMHGKFEKKEEPRPAFKPAPLPQDSILLKTTTAYLRGVWKKPEVSKSSELDPPPISGESGLLKPTVAIAHHSITKEQVLEKQALKEEERQKETLGRPDWARPGTPTRPTAEDRERTVTPKSGDRPTTPRSPKNRLSTSPGRQSSGGTGTGSNRNSTGKSLGNKSPGGNNINGNNTSVTAAAAAAPSAPSTTPGKHSANNGAPSLSPSGIAANFKQKYEELDETDFIQEDDGDDVDGQFDGSKV